ncbi:GNAT family N-acetyltransferase [Seleniivibrio sp.]|uniref:GNAT family N-acetyltransferase n=1 Tax=Seleniivibrio sp. TaxID=2898801 RepID=UPI0025F4F790|nr:GNAT family N-acetyltransferase [Seleniivibrio sp.]MCD8552521.1 GNAT family N-acetyltransferase [Seleniivibrio sp.]
MEITKAELKDIPALCELLCILFMQEADFTPDADKQAEGLKLIISDPSVGFIVKAEDNGKILGMVNILYTVSTFIGGRAAVLEDMVVLPEVRGKDIGSQIIKKAEELAKEAGCMRITLLTDCDNTGGQRFYRRQGYTLSPMVPMRKML